MLGGWNPAMFSSRNYRRDSKGALLQFHVADNLLIISMFMQIHISPVVTLSDLHCLYLQTIESYLSQLHWHDLSSTEEGRDHYGRTEDGLTSIWKPEKLKVVYAPLETCVLLGLMNWAVQTRLQSTQFWRTWEPFGTPGMTASHWSGSSFSRGTQSISVRLLPGRFVTCQAPFQHSTLASLSVQLHLWLQRRPSWFSLVSWITNLKLTAVLSY